jgi:hypothetical protein
MRVSRPAQAIASRRGGAQLTQDPVLQAVSEDMKVCQLRLAVDGTGRDGPWPWP